jgi:hypothetical protein
MTAPWERPCSAPQKVLIVFGYVALLTLWGVPKIPAVIFLLVAKMLYLAAESVNSFVDGIGLKVLDWLVDEKPIEEE